MWMKIQSELTSFSWLIFEVGDVGIEPTTRRLRGALGDFVQVAENNNQSKQRFRRPLPMTTECFGLFLSRGSVNGSVDCHAASRNVTSSNSTWGCFTVLPATFVVLTRMTPTSSKNRMILLRLDTSMLVNFANS